MMTPDYARSRAGSRRGSYPGIRHLLTGGSAVRLLTGAKPHRFANSTLREIERAICEEEVVRPSSTVAIGASAATERRSGSDSADGTC